MRRLPLLPTLVVAAAVAAMIALGIWQLQRAAWKEAMLASYVEASARPVVDLDPLLDNPPETLPPLAFRRVLVSCRADQVAPDVHAGRNRAQAVGQVYVIPCRAGAGGLAGRLRINAGWASRPDAVRRLSLSGIVAGRMGAVEADRPIMLTAASALPPLVPAAPSSIENIPNNHRAYAFQWFFFAAVAALIYGLALRRRGAPSLPPEP